MFCFNHLQCPIFWYSLSSLYLPLSSLLSCNLQPIYLPSSFIPLHLSSRSWDFFPILWSPFCCYDIYTQWGIWRKIKIKCKLCILKKFWYLSFWIWLTSLDVMISSCICFPANVIHDLIFLYGWITLHCVSAYMLSLSIYLNVNIETYSVSLVLWIMQK